ncbi:acyl-coenzyme A thioesterase 2, chloroplastic-like [Carex rostrata]
MISKGVDLDAVIYCTLIEGLCKEERQRDAKQNVYRRTRRSPLKERRLRGLRNLLAKGRVFCDLPTLVDRDSILSWDTRPENSIVCRPQQRNLHGRFFELFLMHQAYELAFYTSYAFVGHGLCFVEVDHVDFLKRVDVGDFLRFKSCVLHMQLESPDQPLIHVEVEAHVTRPELHTKEVSDTFYFTFGVDQESIRNRLKISNVAPGTKEEARRILQRMDSENIS